MNRNLWKNFLKIDVRVEFISVNYDPVKKSLSIEPVSVEPSGQTRRAFSLWCHEIYDQNCI